MFFWILAIIALFALGISYGVFNSQKQRALVAKENVRELLWHRSSLVPLLLSLCDVIKSTNSSLFSQLLAIRSSLYDEHFLLSDRLIQEAKFSELINKIIYNSKSTDELSKNYSLITLAKEFDSVRNSINKSVSEYNNQCKRLTSMLKFPWFSLWTLFAKNDEKGGIQTV